MRTAAEAEIEPHYRRSLEFARQAGDRRLEAWALYDLAFVYDFVALTVDPNQADQALAIRLRQEALDIFRAIGDRRGIGESLWALGGNSVAMRNDPATARVHLAEASVVLAEIGNSYGAAWANMSLGMLESLSGNLDAARAAMLRSAELFLGDDDITGQIIAIQALGALAARSGDDATAVRLGAAAVALARRIGVDPPLIAVLHEPLVEARGRLTPDAVTAEEAAAQSIEARPFLEAAIAESAAWASGSTS
jgi:hypothetical protein